MTTKYPKEGTKYVKEKKGVWLIGELQDLIIEKTNSSLISLEINRLCQKFVEDLKKIPLSEELQNPKQN